MKWNKIATLATLAVVLSAGQAFSASTDFDRERSDAGKMMHKLGRGITNILTSWVEIPRNVAMEWERTDPVTGTVIGAVKGFGWGFTRLATGVYETFTFPFPIPKDYDIMMTPEFVVSDVWGDGIPELTDPYANDPKMSGSTRSQVYPDQFRF